MFTKDADFAHETANFEFAIATANRLKPAFVVITGDLINKAGDAAHDGRIQAHHRQARPEDQALQRAGQPRRGQRADRGIAGASTASVSAPTTTVSASGDIAGIVLNSNLEKGTEKVPEEAAKMEAWFRGELERAKQAGREAHHRLPAHFVLPERRRARRMSISTSRRRFASGICSCCTSTACSRSSPATIIATNWAATAIWKW